MRTVLRLQEWVNIRVGTVITLFQCELSVVLAGGTQYTHCPIKAERSTAAAQEHLHFP